MKKTFSSELAWLAGTVILALGTAMMSKADMGLSTVVAPAYLLFRKISQYLPFFTFGMAEYTLQAVILAGLSLFMGRFRKSYLFSFVSAVIYGTILDLFLIPVNALPDTMAVRLILYFTGMAVCSLGVAFVFHTYISPAAYELCVSEITRKLNADIGKVKIIYDLVSCAIAVAMSFAFFGFMHFEGIKAGTLLCALINGPLISFFSKNLESAFEFRDTFALRKYFET